MKSIFLVGCLLVSSILFNPVTWSAVLTTPQVVVSIKPLHSLVAGVMLGVGEPQLLVKGGGSPHGYMLRPSEARALANAELVVWVGPQLESFLEKPLATLGRQARQLELAEELKPYLLPLRQGGKWERHQHKTEKAADHHEPADSHGKDEHTENNPHLWLDPLLAIRIVDLTAAALSEIDPANRNQYESNAAQMKIRLTNLHTELKSKLAPVQDVPYIVFHDAYQYFETAFGLNTVGSLTIDPERKPGAKRIIEIRKKISESNARCVFSEPQFEPRLVATVIEGSGARNGILDPLGADLPVGSESYFQLLNNLADNLLEGLGQ